MTPTHLLSFVLCLLASLCLVSPASAIELRYGPINPDEPGDTSALILTGEIKTGDYLRFLEFARSKPRHFNASTLVLASPGGNILEAMRIGTFVRKTFQSVFVSNKIGRCASACFLIYVAAVNRGALVPSLGVHRPHFPTTEFQGMSLSESRAKQGKLMGAVRQYLEENEVPKYLIERMFSLASTEVYWLARSDLNALGSRAYWWDQVLVDRCNLDKVLEQKYLVFGEALPNAREAERHLRDVAVCAYNVSAEDRESNLRSLLAEKR